MLSEGVSKRFVDSEIFDIADNYLIVLEVIIIG